MFCPKCGALLMPKKDDKKTLQCSCGYKKADAAPFTLNEVTEKKDTDVAIVDTEFETAPLTDEECPECKHPKAFYWLVQTRAADEAETKFLKCEKCKHTWRDYS